MNKPTSLKHLKKFLTDGSWIHIMKTVCSEIRTKDNERMPSKGLVNDKLASILRDSGCSDVVIKKELVKRKSIY